MIRDVTEARRMEDSLRITNQCQAALLKLYEMYDEPLDTIIGFVVEECRKIGNSKLAFIGFVNETETMMDTRLWGQKAMDECRVRGKPALFPLEGAGLWGEAVRRREAVIANDYSEGNPLKRGCPEGHLPIIRFMGVPLVHEGRVVLMAGLANKGTMYDESDAAHVTLILEGMWNFMQRLRTGAAVREVAARYKALFENANDAILLMTKDCFVDCNRRALELFACDREGIIGKTLFDLSPPFQPDGNDSTRKALEKIGLALSGMPQTFEWKHRKADGSAFDAEVGLNAITLEGGTHLQVIVHDITGHKRSEDELGQTVKKLEEADEILSAAINASTEALIMIDRDGTILLCNTTVAGRLGKSVAQLLHTCLYDHFPPDVAALRRKQYMRVFETGQALWFQDTRAGRYYDQHVYPIFNAQDAVSRVVIYANDITERILVEETLLKSEEEYRSIYNNAMVGIFQRTPGGRYLRVNPAFSAMLGFSSSVEMVEATTDGRDQLYVDPGDFDELNRLLEDNDTVWNFETRLYRKDRNMIWVSMNVRAVYDRDGRVALCQGIVEDITKRKRAEQALARNEARLESLLKIAEYQAATVQEFLDFALDEAVALTESRIGYIYFYDEKARRFTLNAWSREVTGQCTIKNPKIVYDLEETGVWGEAVRQRRPMVLNDFTAPHPLRRGCPEGHAPLERFMTIPVFSGPDIVAVVGVANKGSAYEDSDIRQLRLLMASVWKHVERRSSEEALRESEERYRSIYENAVEGMYQSTPEGRLLSSNPAHARMLGYSSPEELVSDMTDIGTQVYANPEDRVRFRKLLDKDGFVRQFEFPALKRDGERIWVSNSARTVRDTAGNLLYYEGTIEDITRIKKSEEDLKASADKLRKSLAGTIEVISMMVETRDPCTAGHQRRVSKLACSIARQMGLPKDVTDAIRMAANIHDIGKMSVPAEMLAKPTRLSDVEMEFMKMHPRTGYDLLKVVDLPVPVAEIVLQHHERCDGSGYPQGLKEEEILLEAQIIAVADVVEAMVSHRPYRPALGIRAALGEIERNRGILYYPDVADTCRTLFKENGFRFDDEELDGRPSVPVARDREAL